VTQAAAERTWTILELLRWTTEHFAKQGIASARLDAECLLAHALGVERLRLYVEFDKPLAAAERAGFRELVRRRAEQRVPVAQLVGRKEFWSLPLAVTPDVLVPRPETETLVEAALALAPERDAELCVLDVGTGSGAVALALAHERPRARVTATDVSPAALAVARANAERLGLSERVRFLEGSLYEPLAGERFDLVLSNPPYLWEAPGAAHAPELAHEPRQALFAPEQGLGLLRALAQGAPGWLKPGGAAAFELSPEQAARVAGWCRDAGLLDVTQWRDLARRVRVVSGRAAQAGAATGRAAEAVRGSPAEGGTGWIASS
jgi:release factor glutamine methyltransferase